MISLVPLQFGIPGGMELVIILFIAVLLFGASKLPKLARSTGQAMGEFRKGRAQIESELDDLTGSGSLDDSPETEDGERSEA